MIVTIRGTSGSGKSTLVKRVMESGAYQSKMPQYVQGRKQPLGYWLSRPHDSPGAHLRVLGHYESPTGGGDTINQGLDHIDGLVRETLALEYPHDVIYEGLVVSSDFKRIVKLHHEGEPCMVLVLATPLDECVRSVEQRRRARGNDKPLNTHATIAKYRSVLNHIPRFRAEGLRVEHLDREEAYQCLREVLRLP